MDYIDRVVLSRRRVARGFEFGPEEPHDISIYPRSSSLPEPPVHLCSLHREMQLRLVLQADFSLLSGPASSRESE